LDKLYVKKFLLIVGSLLLISAPLYLLKHQPHAALPEPVLVLSRYLKSSYARDYKQAYRLISARDRQFKPEDVYIRERGTFNGFTLAAARKLSESIVVKPVKITSNGDRTTIKAALKLPDAGSLAPLLLDWDEEKLNALPAAEQRKILAAIDGLRRRGTMKMIEGEEEYALVKEDKAWRLALDWDSGLRISFASIVPGNGTIEAEPIPPETVVKSSEPFRISYRVRNLSDKPIRTRIIHIVEPEELRQYVDIVECALLLPVTVQPGSNEEYSTTYLLDGGLPESVRRFKITYAFKIEP
jgi:Cytochrome c oxidase assembly protein CtaG/Cox11